MLFSSITFLYYFLPVFLILYFSVPFKFKNAVLFVSSLFFYFWGEPVYVFLMIISTLLGYIFGLLIDKYRGTKASRFWMTASVVTGIGLLIIFKYSDFFIETVNFIPGISLKTVGIALPIGISFYTFQILSYTVDLYRGNAAVQKSFVSFASYVTLFPQLIAGPIVRYTDIAAELTQRKHNIRDFSSGVVRFVLGLGKKVLLANILGEFCEVYRKSGEKSVVFVWAYVFAYGFHIYFDFSGYSDMAIGLGKMLGFRFLENFNYPFISKSITEFWRRWHISLGSWFRDYVYIPLGGNRVPLGRHIFNIFVVWFLTGFWHGAGWNFIVWGLYFAVFLLFEKFVIGFKDGILRLPAAVSHVYTLFVLAFGWVLFDSASIPAAFSTVGSMFGAGVPLANTTSLYYIRSYALPIIIAALGATPLPKWLVSRLCASKLKKIVFAAESLAIASVLLVVTAYLIDGSFNPFIYFRF